jgi:hypothetical protein
MDFLPLDATWTSADALFIGTTVRYHWRDNDGIATVVETTDDRVAFSGPECGGRFSHEQIDRLFENDRLQVVLDDSWHASSRRVGR